MKLTKSWLRKALVFPFKWLHDKLRREKEVMPVHPDWVKKTNPKQDNPNQTFMMVEVKKPRFTIKNPGVRFLNRALSLVWVIFNFVLAVTCIFTAWPLAIFFFVNTWLIVHVYRSSKRRELIEE